MSTPTPTVAEIERFLRVIVQPGNVFEVRIVNCASKKGSSFTSTVSGYYQHSEIPKAASDIAKVDAAGLAPAIYITLSPVLAVLLARSKNRLRQKAKETTSNHEVTRRLWILIDCDPVRPAGISATDEELAAALETGERVRAFLAERGWPEPVVIMSGNGRHLLIRIDLPADDGGLVQRVLEALAARFDSERVKIDRGVHNAARITKVAGTIAGKGDTLVGVEGLEDRPHRRAVLEYVPDPVVAVTREQLEALAAEVPPAPPKGAGGKATPPIRPKGTPNSKFEKFVHNAEGVRGYLAAHGVAVKSEARDAAATLLHLERCPVNPECVSTGDSDITVFVGDDGKLGYKNLHSRGDGLTWLDVREALEPGYKEWSVLGIRDLARAESVTVGAVRLTCRSTDKKGRLLVSATTTADGKEVARDKVDTNASRSRASFTKALAKKLSLTAEQIESLDEALRNLEPPSAAKAEAEAAPPLSDELLAAKDEHRQAMLDAMPPEIVALAAAMLVNPRLIDLVLRDVAAVGVVGERVLGATLYVEGTSRLLKNPVSAIVQGTSSSGKSYVIIKVASLFPPEAVLLATDITTNALYYMPVGALMHTWVVGGERPRIDDDEKAEAKRALREMLSGGELRKAIPVKLPDGGFETKVLFQPGPIAFVESTTRARLFDEDANRCLLLSTNESEEQTAMIIDAAAAAAEEEQPDTAAIVLRHHALQRMLRRVKVRVPFARALGKFVPRKRPEARRAFHHILAMIQSVALLHQRQRTSGEVRDGDVIAATIQDYVIARRLLESPLGRSLGGSLTDAVARFGWRLAKLYGMDQFDSTRATKSDDILSSKGKVNEYLRALADAGVIECVQEHKGGKPNVWKFVGPVPEPGAAWLPTVEKLTEAMS